MLIVKYEMECDNLTVVYIVILLTSLTAAINAINIYVLFKNTNESTQEKKKIRPKCFYSANGKSDYCVGIAFKENDFPSSECLKCCFLDRSRINQIFN